MPEHQERIIHEPLRPRLSIVMLHGLGMHPEVLEPFALSLNLHAVLSVPRGPVTMPDGAPAWWGVDTALRESRRANGPEDLFDRHPAGRAGARKALDEVVDRVLGRWPQLPLMLVGYSQGGMLAMDYLLMDGARKVSACALLSTSRIAFDEWQLRLSRLAGLNVLVAHGRHDDRLAFTAGEKVRDCMTAGGAQVEWMPFDGGHELPLAVWRRLRKFVLGMTNPTIAA